MTPDVLHLDVEAIRFRRITLNIATRVVAHELGMAEAGFRRIEQGTGDEHLTIHQLGRLARMLEMDPRDLIRSTHDEVQPEPEPADDELVSRLGPLLFLIGRAVPVATLADIVRSDSETVSRALDQLRDQLAPGGLVVSVGKPGATLVPAHTRPGAAQARQLLRQAERRSALNTPGGRLLHQLARGEHLPQVLRQPQRQQLSILVNAGWVDAPARPEPDAPRFRLSADVAFSLVLDDGEPTETACASVWTAPTGQAKFKWLEEA